MTARPMSPNQMAREAREAFDLDFQEAEASIKSRLESLQSTADEQSIESKKIQDLLGRMNQIREERIKLGKSLCGLEIGSYRERLNDLATEVKSIRGMVFRLLDISGEK